MACGSMLCFADPVALDKKWYNFKATPGVDYGAGIGVAYNHTSAEPKYYNPGRPPWTIVAPAEGAKLTVLDGGEIGDVFDVYDGSELIGTTSTPRIPSPPCGDEPEVCLAGTAGSRGVFTLGAGMHSITIKVRSSPYPSSFQSWFRVEPTDPGTPASDLPAITSIMSAAGSARSTQPFIQAGSWVTLFGIGLATETVAWDGQLVNGKLPTTLGGVSVLIDGKSAFLNYVSPGQINVQAPDIRAGSVDVIVRNSTGESRPATAQVRISAPAFFQWQGTDFAVATLHPDGRFVGDPAPGSDFVGVRRGDIVILWGTGFGPTTPVAEAGAPSGESSLTVTPVIRIGTVTAPVIGGALTPGMAGLYQIAIQIPDNAAAGNNVIRAASGEVESPGGVYIYILGQ